MKTEQQTVELLSRLRKGKGKVHVPKGTIAIYDAANGPFKVKGELHNEGTIAIKGSQTAKVAILATGLINNGKIEADVQSLSLCVGSMDNSGEIAGSQSVNVIATAGPLKVSSKGGLMSAAEEIVIDAPLGLIVSDGTFSAPSIQLKSERGVAAVAAEKLDGKVTVMAKSSSSSNGESPERESGVQSLLSGTHAYWNYGNSFYLDEDIDHGSDEVAILSTHHVTVDGNITCGKLTLAAGVSFKIGGNYPSPGQVEDSGSSWEIESSEGGGSITINGDLEASDDVVDVRAWTFEVFGDTVSIDGSLTTGANTRFDADTSISVTDEITTTRPANILLFSDGDVGTGAITIDNSTGSTAGRLCIKAHRNGGSSEFIIGDEDNPNGVNGPIVVDTVSGGGSEQSSYWYGGVYISNGGDGGITLTNSTDISVAASQSKSGGIILDAHDGTITLPAGTLSADGTGSYPGGMIQLLAETIETEDGTVISASDSGQGTQKIVQLAANTINMAGSSGLTIKADGDANETYPNYIQIVPKGSVTIEDNDSVIFFNIWQYMPSGTFNNTGEVAFAGTGTAPLSVSSNGSHSRIEMSGYPLTFAGGTVDIECKGEENHEIMIAYYGTPSGINAVEFNGDDVTIDASGTDSEDADGGKITLSMPKPLRSDDGKITVKADGSENGKGGEIIMYPGDIDLALGTDDEQWSFSAKGGSTSGDGGKIELFGYESALEVFGAGPTTTVLDVSVPGDDGNGGEITIVAYDGLTFDGMASHLKADGGSSSGDGGKITILTSINEFIIGTGETGAVQLSAIANGGDGKGGTIDVTSWYGITADSGYFDVTADGNGDGGTIKLNAGYSTFELNGGEVHADGGDTGGNGGLIHLEGGEIVLPAEENTLLAANGNNGGNGGDIEVVTQWGSVDIGGDDGEMSMEAKGSEETLMLRSLLANGYGDGGRTFVWQASHFKTSGVAIDVRAYSDGTGGKILINCTDYIHIDANLTANGSGEGRGGEMKLEAPTVKIKNTCVFNAKGGPSNGNGGTIEILNTNSIQFVDGAGSPANAPTSLMFDLQGMGNGEGGELKIAKVDTIAVNTVINVNGGPTATASTFYGSIELNGIKCRQRKRNDGDIASLVWPQTYWDGVDTTTSTPSTVADETLIGALQIPNDHGLRDLLDAQDIHIYAMDVVDDFLDFFAQTPPQSTNGIYGISLHDSIKISTVFQNVNVAGNPASAVTTSGKATIMRGTAVHELAHQLDVLSWGGDSQLTGAGTFGQAISDDITTQQAGYINFESCNTVWGSTICGQHPGLTNSQILAARYKGTAYELYAQVFEHLLANWVHADLEQALGYLPKQLAYIQDVIDNGHP